MFICGRTLCNMKVHDTPTTHETQPKFTVGFCEMHDTCVQYSFFTRCSTREVIRQKKIVTENLFRKLCENKYQNVCRNKTTGRSIKVKRHKHIRFIFRAKYKVDDCNACSFLGITIDKRAIWQIH